MNIKPRIQSIKCACRGIQKVLINEPNARIHLFLAIIALALGIVLRISRTEWLIIVLCIGGVISTEAMNSAVEKLIDIISPEHNENAGLVKDMAASAVLVMALAALSAGLIIFIPHIHGL